MTKPITDLEGRLDAAFKRADKNPAAVALGSMTSERKKKSSRENGKLGGAPKGKRKQRKKANHPPKH